MAVTKKFDAPITPNHPKTPQNTPARRSVLLNLISPLVRNRMSDKNKHVCGYCNESVRVDRFLAHILKTHSYNISGVMDPHDVTQAIENKSPMMWKVNWHNNSKYGNFEYALCLVCKTEKGYNPVGHFKGGRGNVKNFHAEHFKGQCRQRWNEVCHLFGAEPNADPLPPAKPFQPPSPPPPPPIVPKVPLITQGTLDHLNNLLQIEQGKVQGKDVLLAKCQKEVDDLKGKLFERDRELIELRKVVNEARRNTIPPQSTPTLQIVDVAPDSLTDKVKNCKCCSCEKNSCTLCYEHESGRHDNHDQIFRSTECENCGEEYMYLCGCEGTPDRCWRCNDKWKDCICG